MHNRFYDKIGAGFHKNAISYLLALRLIPVVPFWVVNIVPALLGMRLNHYVLTTFIGITPGTLIMSGLPEALIACCQAGKTQTCLF